MIAWLSLLALCAADVSSDLLRMRNAFAESEFEDAALLANAIVATVDAERAAVVEARRIGGFSEFYLGRPTQAARHLAALFALAPDDVLDARLYPPALVDFYEGEHRVALERAATVATAASAPTTGRFNPLALIPFGVGQMLQGDFLAGGIFLGVDVALLTLDLALYATRLAERRPDLGYADPNRARNQLVFQNITAAALVASTVVGVLDAVFWCPRRMGRPPVVLAPTPGGAALVGAF